MLTRDEFREKVFARDKGRCVVCGDPAQDAHHILERRLWDDGGYYIENGASVCGPCHMKCEMTLISVEDLRTACGINKPIIPPQLYDSEIYDKWGDIILANGQRLRGELFFDESVQKILKEGGVLDRFTNRVKYPRTWHLPWSLGMHDDDRVMTNIERFVGQQVVVHEKMDGECLAAKTKITMADGSQCSIRELVKNGIGREVLGQTVDGQIVKTRITKVYNNGSTEDWLRIKIREKHGTCIYCTPNERFYVPEKGYVPAHQIEVGCDIVLLDSYRVLTERQHQLLLGKLLGDGSIHVGRNRNGIEDHDRKAATIQWSHKIEHEEYIKWFLESLGSIAGNISTTEMISGYGTEMKKAWTKSDHAIYRSFYNTASKFPIFKCLSPISLAVFYMDDGSLAHSDKKRDRVTFSVCDYTEEQCDLLIKMFSSLGLDASKKLYDYWYLFLNADNADKLFQMISKYIPACMQYKLPDQYRGLHIPFTNEDDNGIQFYTKIAKVVEIDSRKPLFNQKIKYDLETETHNFFANSVLVHNCTTMYQDYIHARSIDSPNHPSRNWVKGLWGRIKHDIPEDYRICVENMYAEHSIPYDNLPSYAFGFSVWNERNECLSWAETKEWLELLGITPCPVIYEGVFDEKLIKGLYNEKTDWATREGYVMRIADKFSYADFRHCVGKFVRRGHVQTTKHWMHGQPIIPNKLAK